MIYIDKTGGLQTTADKAVAKESRTDDNTPQFFIKCYAGQPYDVRVEDRNYDNRNWKLTSVSRETFELYYKFLKFEKGNDLYHSQVALSTIEARLRHGTSLMG